DILWPRRAPNQGRPGPPWFGGNEGITPGLTGRREFGGNRGLELGGPAPVSDPGGGRGGGGRPRAALDGVGLRGRARPGARVVDMDSGGEPAGQEGTGPGRVLIEVDVDHLQAAIAVAVGELFEDLQVLLDLRAGTRPEVHDDEPAAHLR